MTALIEADLEFLDHPHGSIIKSLKVSVDILPHDQRQLYFALGVFPANTVVPKTAVLTLWQYIGSLTERNARKLITTLERKALLRVEGEGSQRRIALHDLQYDYLRAAQADLMVLHNQLLAAYYQKCGGDGRLGQMTAISSNMLPITCCKAAVGRNCIDYSWIFNGCRPS